MIIIISGAINSGKTSTGIELARQLPNAKFIDVDWIFGEKETCEMEKRK
ncbi:MAG: hypothetical protein N4A43_04820 [Alphaproteobacteria bacterium]|jgi:shikimate kinase|nr:hypothetical protein [Alphaproteobacteria bacterium]